MGGLSVGYGSREIGEARRDDFEILDKKYKSLFNFLQLGFIITFTYNKVY